ncbi:MAG: hypothetical protein KJ638_06055, partial [Chloroflexi bacterium]|nr:hypothetical protein [Chloroflexota bacterium]
MIDGLDFDKDITSILEELKDLNQEFGVFIWFSMKSHRDQAWSDDGFPVQLASVKNLFDKAIFL